MQHKCIIITVLSSLTKIKKRICQLLIFRRFAAINLMKKPEKENKSLKYKEQLTKTYLKTVSAFANYGEGKIILVLLMI